MKKVVERTSKLDVVKLMKYLEEPGNLGHILNYQIGTKLVVPKAIFRAKLRSLKGLNEGHMPRHDGWQGCFAASVRIAVGSDGKKEQRNPDGTITKWRAEKLGIDDCWCGANNCTSHAMDIFRDEMDTSGKVINSVVLVRAIFEKTASYHTSSKGRQVKILTEKLAISFPEVVSSHALRPDADYHAEQIRYWMHEYLNGVRDTQLRNFVKSTFRANGSVAVADSAFYLSNNSNEVKLSLAVLLDWINHGQYNDHQGQDVPIRRGSGNGGVGYDVGFSRIGDNEFEKGRVTDAIPHDFAPKLSKLSADIKKAIDGYNAGKKIQSRSLKTQVESYREMTQDIAKLEKEFGTTFTNLGTLAGLIRKQLSTLGKSMSEKVNL